MPGFIVVCDCQSQPDNGKRIPGVRDELKKIACRGQNSNRILSGRDVPYLLVTGDTVLHVKWISLQPNICFLVLFEQNSRWHLNLK